MSQPGHRQRLRVQEYHYSDEETGEPRLGFDVMAETPETWPEGQPWRGTGCWGDWYRIARYSDKAAADEHARTGRKPHGYG